MQYFDFHHHKKNAFGIYNLTPYDMTYDQSFSVGIHPKDAKEDYKEQIAWFKKNTIHTNCKAIGECGLDGIVETDFELQKKVFLEQINWANTINKPIIIHCVRRFSELIPFKKASKVPMIIHGYNKKATIADQLKQEGFHLSFGKSLLENLSLQTVFRDYPANRFFLETDDANFDIEILYQKAAEIKSITIEELQSQIQSNLNEIYNP